METTTATAFRMTTVVVQYFNHLYRYYHITGADTMYTSLYTTGTSIHNIVSSLLYLIISTKINLLRFLFSYVV